MGLALLLDEQDSSLFLALIVQHTSFMFLMVSNEVTMWAETPNGEAILRSEFFLKSAGSSSFSNTRNISITTDTEPVLSPDWAILIPERTPTKSLGKFRGRLCILMKWPQTLNLKETFTLLTLQHSGRPRVTSLEKICKESARCLFHTLFWQMLRVMPAFQPVAVYVGWFRWIVLLLGPCQDLAFHRPCADILFSWGVVFAVYKAKILVYATTATAMPHAGIQCCFGTNRG